MHRAIATVCFALVLLCGSGCNSAPSGPPLAKVKGTVYLDNKPLAKGEVILSVPGMPPKVLEVANGTFSGQAHEGKNRVEVKAYKVGPPLSTDPGGPPTKVNVIP